MPSKKRIDTEGSIYQRHDTARYGCPPSVEGDRPDHKCKGPWVGSLVINHKTVGNKRVPVRKKVSGTTRSDVARKLLELHHLRRSSELPVGKPVTVAQWMDYWLTRIAPVEVADGERRRRAVKESTVETYTTNIENYIKPLLGHHRLDHLNADHIDDAWDQLLTDGNPKKAQESRVPLSANSVALCHSILRRSLKVAVQRKRITFNPAGTDSMDAPAKNEQEVVPIPVKDVQRILDATEHSPNGARWSVALALGLRPGEVRGLRWEDVDLEAGVLTVAQQLQRRKGRGLVVDTPKTKKGARQIPLPKTLLANLKRHRKEQAELRLAVGEYWHDNDLVFTLDDGRPLDAKVDRDRWYRVLEDAGIPRYRLYDARHSAATMLLLQGVPIRVVMEILGHSSIQVTMKYQHAVEEAMKDAAVKMEAGFWG